MPERIPDLTLRQALVLMAIGRGRLHGPAIIASCEELTGDELPITQGALYVTLQRMEHSGLLASELENPRARNPANRRRYYEVTPAGRQALERIRALWRKLLNQAKHQGKPPHHH